MTNFATLLYYNNLRARKHISILSKTNTKSNKIFLPILYRQCGQIQTHSHTRTHTHTHAHTYSLFVLLSTGCAHPARTIRVLLLLLHTHRFTWGRETRKIPCKVARGRTDAPSVVRSTGTVRLRQALLNGGLTNT